jgi:hypothetical protein
VFLISHLASFYCKWFISLSVLFKEGWYLYVAFTTVAAVTIIILYGSIRENCCGGCEVVVLNRYGTLNSTCSTEQTQMSRLLRAYVDWFFLLFV